MTWWRRVRTDDGGRSTAGRLLLSAPSLAVASSLSLSLPLPVSTRRPGVESAEVIDTAGPALPGNLVALAIPVALAVALVVVVGAALWARARGRARLKEQARLLARERGRRLRLERRVHIVSEMYDVAAGHVSRIAVQASTAEFRIGVLTPPLKQEFEAFGAAARESLIEMGRLLDVLRDGDDAQAQGSQPGLADVPALVERARTAGTPVRLLSAKLPSEVPPLVGLTAYRIVEEALANAARHSVGAATTVALMLAVPGDGDAHLVVSVSNDAPPGGTAADVQRETADAGGADGLADLRERVALVGGELEAGPRGDGFVVKATLPLTRVRAAERPATRS